MSPSLLSLPVTIVKTASAMKDYTDCPGVWIGPDCHKVVGTGGRTNCNNPDSSFNPDCNNNGRGAKGGGEENCHDDDNCQSKKSKCHDDDNCQSKKSKCHDDDNCQSKNKPNVVPKSNILPPTTPSPPPSTPVTPSASFIPILIVAAIPMAAIVVWKAAHRNKNGDYARNVTGSTSNKTQVTIGVITKGGIKRE
jgi:hypothetical protein